MISLNDRTRLIVYLANFLNALLIKCSRFDSLLCTILMIKSKIVPIDSTLKTHNILVFPILNKKFMVYVFINYENKLTKKEGVRAR